MQDLGDTYGWHATCSTSISIPIRNSFLIPICELSSISTKPTQTGLKDPFTSYLLVYLLCRTTHTIKISKNGLFHHPSLCDFRHRSQRLSPRTPDEGFIVQMGESDFYDGRRDHSIREIHGHVEGGSSSPISSPREAFTIWEGEEEEIQ